MIVVSGFRVAALAWILFELAGCIAPSDRSSQSPVGAYQLQPSASAEIETPAEWSAADQRTYQDAMQRKLSDMTIKLMLLEDHGYTAYLGAKDHVVVTTGHWQIDGSNLTLIQSRENGLPAETTENLEFRDGTLYLSMTDRGLKIDVPLQRLDS